MTQYNGGWVPYPDRTEEQQKAHDAWADETPLFCDVNSGVNLPEESIGFHAFEMLGMQQPRVWQQTGSCVGAGDAVADCNARAGDVVIRGDQERVELPFPYATWGYGRYLAGMGGPGEGSYGSIQARAAAEWGYLEFADSRVPRPTISDVSWYAWSAKQERQWSWPSGWPEKPSVLGETAKKFRAGRSVPAKTIEEVDQALAQCFGVTMASNYGSRNETMRTIDGLLVAKWDGEWAHQMCVDKFKTVEGRKYYLILNQWGPRAHPSCPYVSRWGVRGCFWVPRDDLVRNLKMKYTEVMVHTSTGGFEPQNITWSKG